MNHKQQISNYLQNQTKDSVIFTVRCIHITPRGHIIKRETRANRRKLGQWIGKHLVDGILKIDDFIISVYSTGTPHSYIARRVTE